MAARRQRAKPQLTAQTSAVFEDMRSEELAACAENLAELKQEQEDLQEAEKDCGKALRECEQTVLSNVGEALKAAIVMMKDIHQTFQRDIENASSERISSSQER